MSYFLAGWIENSNLYQLISETVECGSVPGSGPANLPSLPHQTNEEVDDEFDCGIPP